MKKYIAPITRTIVLFEENELMQTGSPQIGNGEGSGVESNRRDASSNIWGED